MKSKDILGREIRLGIGLSDCRLVIQRYDNFGATFFAGERQIEEAPLEKISIEITPNYILCMEVVFNQQQILMRLGQNRFFAAMYRGKGKLFAAYLPDEKDLENNSSEVMTKLGNRGLW